MFADATYHRLSRAAVVLDRLRTALLTLTARSSWLKPYVVHKETRIATQALTHMLLALVATLLCPSLLLVVGPLLLGVPHVANDVRYLVLRRSLPRAFTGLVLGFSVVLLGLRLLETRHLDNPRFASVEVVLVGLWLVLAVLLSRGQRTRSWLVLGGSIGLALLALLDATLSRLVFAHAHNVVGLVVWYALFRPRSWRALLPLACVLLVSLGLFALGEQAPILWPVWFDLHVEAASHWLAPGLAAGPARGLVLSYVFLQSVHYAIWLLFIPQDADRRPGTATFCRSLRSAWEDFRPWGLVAVLGSLLLVLGAACFDPLTTSAVYLFVTPFHGYLELAILAACLVSSRKPSSATQPQRSATQRQRSTSPA